VIYPRHVPQSFLTEYCGRVALRLVAIHDTRFPASWMHSLMGSPRLLPRASYRADGRPYTGPSILTCAHLASVDPASGRWEDLFLPGSPRDRSVLLSISDCFAVAGLTCHALTLAYTCWSLSGFNCRSYNKVFILKFYWSDVYFI